MAFHDFYNFFCRNNVKLNPWTTNWSKDDDVYGGKRGEKWVFRSNGEKWISADREEEAMDQRQPVVGPTVVGQLANLWPID